MKLEGTWRVKEVLMGTEDGIKSLSLDEIAALEENEDTQDLKQMAGMVLKIEPNIMKAYFRLDTEEKMAIAREEGMEIDGDLALIETHEIKEEDGKILIECGMMDDKPYYDELCEDEDGCLAYAGGMLRLVRA